MSWSNNAANATVVRGPFWTEPLTARICSPSGCAPELHRRVPRRPADDCGWPRADRAPGITAPCPTTGPLRAQKAGADKMAADMARELRPYGVAAVSIGWAG